MPALNPIAAFENLKARVGKAISAQFPYVGKLHRLELVSLDFRDAGDSATDPLHVDNVTSQLETKLVGGTWAVPVRARLRLVEIATGKVLDETTITLARLPKITRRYSYIVEGHERQHDGLFRSKARPYHLIANNGDIVAKWNTQKGMGFDILLDPRTKKLKMKYGGPTVPVYPLLRVLGLQDAEIRRAWGDEVHRANATDKPAELSKIHKALTAKGKKGYRAPPTDEVNAFVRQAFDDTRVRPDAMEAAFGLSVDRPTGESLLLSTKRLIGIARGEQGVDDRSSLASKDFATTEDFIAESIEKRTWDLKRKISNNLDRKNKVSEILASNAYWRVIRETFAPAQRPKQTNPLDFVSGHLRTTIRGAFGGIKGENTIVERDKHINPSHLGFLDPVQTPESESTGISLHLPLGAHKEGYDLRISVYDVRAEKRVEVSPGILEHAVVAYPDQVRWRDGKPVPVSEEVVVRDEDRQTRRRPWKDVRYVLRSSKGLFSFSANLIPFLQNDQGNRASMAAKQQEQAVSLLNREAPLVQSKTEGPLTFEQVLGTFSSHASPVDGTVTSVKPAEIVVTGEDKRAARVPIYDHFPLNGGRAMMHAEPVVKVGDRVRKGQLLADSNFSRGGALALGTNARVAYLPYHGLNFEDGIVVSETAAKKLSSLHLHQETLRLFPGTVLNKQRWKDYTLPERASPDRLAKLDDDGIVREGQTVKDGDVLVAAMVPTQRTGIEQELARIHKSLVKDYQDRSLLWDHEYPGRVVRVTKTQDRVIVHVRTEEALAPGDKLAGRHGNKGVISRIIPDHEMPHDKAGEPVHVLLNVAGVPSRMNVGQVLETAASKVARKTGQPYVVDNFSPGTDYMQKVKDDLAKHGLSDTEELFDPKTGASLGQVFTGEQYMLKLHHLVDEKMTARSYGGAYTPYGAPPAGAGIPGGGQKLDLLTSYALLAHGANANLRDAFTMKSDEDQDDVWTAIQTGQPLPPPRPARVLGNFLTYMKAMGINVEKRGSEYVLSPMTDKQTLAVSNGNIRFTDKALHAKGLRTIEEAGGLFDRKITGGLEGQMWSHIELGHRMPNPVFEGPIQKLLGITKKEYEDLVGPSLTDGKSGFEVIGERLQKLDVDKELKRLEAELPKLKDARLHQAYQKVRYLRSLKKLGLTPLDAYTNRVLPVVPPAVRRISIGYDGRQVFDDLNGLYLAVGQLNQQLKKQDPSNPPSETQKTRAALYDALRGLRISGMDLGAGQRRHHKGLMERLGGTPKESIFQAAVMKRRQDLSARSVIVPMPELEMDEVGVPLPIAMELYKPFVVQHLHTRGGYTPLSGQALVKKQDPVAIDALHKVMAERPLLMKRDPALHKFSVMGFRPRVIPGKAIGIHPLVTGGFNADFDGDQLALYTPVSEEAKEEAKRMLPSKNLFSPTNWNVMPVPGQDSLLGIYQATAWGVESKAAAGLSPEMIAKRLKDRALKPSDVVTYMGKKTTAGRLALALALPEMMRNHERLLFDPKFRLDKKTLQDVLADIGRRFPKEYARTVDEWKNLGNKLAYLNGSSFTLNDFHDGRALRDEVLKPYQEREQQVLRTSGLSQAEKEKQVAALYLEARKEMEARGMARYSALGQNRLFEWVASGARGGWDQFGQLVAGPIMVNDPSGKPVPIAITKSFGEGLPLSEYWTHMHGARKGILDRASGTRDPGSLTKEIINTVIDVKITAEDCGTTRGISLPLTSNDLDGRYLAKEVPLKGGASLPARTLVTTQVLAALRKNGVQSVVVRSPLTCRQPTGICGTCYGVNENGKHHPIGTNIGVIAGHALGEPVTQLQMQCNAAGNLLLVRASGREMVCSLEQLWERSDSCVSVDVEGDLLIETKMLLDVAVWDQGQFTKALTLQRHRPDDQMVLVRTSSGRAFVSQGNHPNWARGDAPACPECGRQEIVKFVGHYKMPGYEGAIPKTSVRCQCGHTFTVTREEYEEQQERIVYSQDLEGVFIGVSSYAELTESVPMPLPPYLLGIYLAEGSIRRERVGQRPEEGRKRRHTTQRGLYWRIDSALLTQNEGAIKDRIVRELRENKIPFFLNGKNTEIDSTEFGRLLWSKCGILSCNKQLPPGFLSQDEEWTRQFLAGVFDGDGTVKQDEGCICIDSTSWTLVSQLALLFEKIGDVARVYASTFRGTCKHQPYRLSVFLQARLPSVKDHPLKAKPHPNQSVRYERVVQVKAVEYTGWVYDIATESRAFSSNGIRTHNTFHTGGVATGKTGLTDAFKRAKQLFKVPAKLPGEAPLAEASGPVERVVANKAVGGHDVHVGGKTHYVPASQTLLPHVQAGQVVQKGDPFSDGLLNPHLLLRTTGSMGKVRAAMASELSTVYGEKKTRRRNVETVVRSMTNLALVQAAPGHPEYTRGQTVPLSEVEYKNFAARKAGQPEVSYKPVLKSISEVPLAAQEDWMSRLNHQRLDATYMDGAAQGWSSDIYGKTIPGLAHGAEFGLLSHQEKKP